jgi:hypothetical protein
MEIIPMGLIGFTKRQLNERRMLMKYKVMVMSFDGETQTERPVFGNTRDAWEYAGDLGSKWFFYPFTYVVTESGKTIVEAPHGLKHFEGKRVKTIQKMFKRASTHTEMQDADVDIFINYLTHHSFMELK